MDKKTVFVKTSKGENEVKGKGGSLSGDLKRALFLVDETSTFDEISRRSAPSLRSVLPKIFEELISGGFIRDEAKPFAEQQITVPKAVKQEVDDELDFTSLPRAPVQNKSNSNSGNQNSVLEAQAKAKQEAEDARALAVAEAKRVAEIEAIAKQEALLKEQAETKAKIEAEARMRAEHEAAQVKLQLEAAAKAKAEAEAKAKQEAEASRIKAEEALRIKIEQEVEKAKAEAKLKAEEEAKAHALAEEKARKEAEAAKLKADQEVAKIKAELEAAKAKAEAEQEARARALAEEAARKEVEAAKLKADQEARRIKAEEILRIKIEQEVEKAKAEAKLKADAEAKARALAEEKARKEAEAAKLKAEQEAAKIKAELDAAKAKAEAQAKALAEERAKQEAARLKAEQEAAKMKAELEAAKAKAEAQERALAEERAKQEAERIKAEQEAVKIKAEMEAAKAKSEAEAKAKALAEEAAKKEAEIARLKAEQEAVKIQAELEAAKTKAEAEAKARALSEETARREAEVARIKAEEVAAKIKAEMDAAKVKAEEEAKSSALAEANAKQAAAKLKADMEAKVRAEVEARARALAEERTRQETARMKAQAEAEARALADARTKRELEAANLRAQQDVERIKADAANLANSFHEPASFEHEVAFNSKIDDSRLEADRAALESKIAEQEIALKNQNEEAQKLADEQAKAWAAAEQRANELARAEASRSVHTAPVNENMQPVPKVRKYRKPLPVGKILASLLVVAVLLIWLLPYVMPLNDYIAPIEKQLTAQFKQPVHISALRAETLLFPKLQLENVTIGSAQEIKVGKALLIFDPFSLFSAVKTIRSLELQDVSVDGVSLEKESVWMQEIGSNTGYQLAHVTVRRIKFSNSEIELPLFDGDVELTGQGRVGKVTLRSADEKFVVSLQSDQNKWQFTFNSKGAFPLFPNVLIDDFTSNGELAGPSANFSTIDAQAFGGFMHGNAKLNWQKGWQLQGRIGAKSVELVKLFPKYGVSGELQGDYNFSLSGNKLAQIADVQQVDGSFVVSKAVINNMDMVETVRQGNRQNGRTHVDELSGNFQANSRGQHLQQLQITSSILNGSGSFDVNTNSQLSGHFSVALKAREGGTSALSLSGSLSEPILNAGR